MNERFYRYRRNFGATPPPPLTQHQAAVMWRSKHDKLTMNRLIAGHTWLATDIAARFLHSRDLPAHLGQELSDVGTEAIWRTLERMTAIEPNMRAYLSQAVEWAIANYLEDDTVPARTRREHRAKGIERRYPRTIRMGDWAPPIDKKHGLPMARTMNDAVDQQMTTRLLKGWREQRQSDWQRPADLAFACDDQIDRDLIDLRWDGGGGPRCLSEIAGMLGIPFEQATQRLNRIEALAHLVRGSNVPKCPRTPGQRTRQKRSA